MHRQIHLLYDSYADLHLWTQIAITLPTNVYCKARDMLSQTNLLQDTYSDLYLWTHTAVTLPEASRSAVQFPIRTKG